MNYYLLKYQYVDFPEDDQDEAHFDVGTKLVKADSLGAAVDNLNFHLKLERKLELVPFLYKSEDGSNEGIENLTIE